MKQNRIVFRSSFKMLSREDADSKFTTVSFIPVCDYCNCALDMFSAKFGTPDLNPPICPNCRKIIECARMIMPDASGKLEYEEF